MLTSEGESEEPDERAIGEVARAGRKGHRCQLGARGHLVVVVVERGGRTASSRASAGAE